MKSAILIPTDTKPPSIVKVEGRKNPWRVWFREGGRRQTRHFATRIAAQTFANSLSLENNLPELAVTVDERVLISRLRVLAADSGVSMIDVANAAIEMAQQRGRRAVEIQQAVREYLRNCERRNIREATIRHYRVMVSRFANAHPGDVGNVTRAQVTDYIVSSYRAETSRRTMRTPILAFLRWCGRQQYCDANRWRDPIVWRTVMRDDHTVGIMRPGELALLLRKLPQKLQCAVALLAYTGIRPAGELTRLNWSMFDLRRRVIELPGIATKTRRSRTLHDLPAVVWEWVEWERARCGGTLEGRVLPMTYRNFRETVRGTGVEWSQDITRHSFASYAYHTLGLERTVDIMGHIGGFRMFASRYKAHARPWTARLWFAVRPRK